MTQIIKGLPILSLLILSCSYYGEVKNVGRCTVKDLPYGKVGRIEVTCNGDLIRIVYDNDPEGRDEFIKSVEGKQLKRVKYRKIDPYYMMSADVEMDGYAVEEVWEGEGIRLEAFEFFTEGGRVCYDWEEGYRLQMILGGDKLVLLDENWEGTECR